MSKISANDNNLYYRNQTNYIQPTEVKEYPNYYKYTYEQPASTEKKWGVGLASIIPGLGQAINGQWGKAAGFFFGTIATTFLGKTMGDFANLGLRVWIIIDAVKNARSKFVQIVPKEQIENNSNLNYKV